MLIYTGRVRPNIDTKVQRSELTNEFIIGLSTMNFIVFTDFIESPIAKYNAGFMFIASVLTIIIYNLILIFSPSLIKVVTKVSRKLKRYTKLRLRDQRRRAE